jgi:hypothetical protein
MTLDKRIVKLHKDFEKEVLTRIKSWGAEAEKGCLIMNNLLENIKDPLTFGKVRKVLDEVEKDLTMPCAICESEGKTKWVTYRKFLGFGWRTYTDKICNNCLCSMKDDDDNFRDIEEK